jgi:O-antigen/teichoic acid export membrane protein
MVFVIFFAGEHRTIFVIHAILVAATVIDIRWLFFGVEQLRILVVRAVINMLYAGGIFIFVRNEDGLWIYVLLVAGAGFILNAAPWFYLKKYASLVRPSWQSIRRHTRPLFVLFLPLIFTAVYVAMTRIILGAVAGEVELGFYANAEKLPMVVVGLISAFGGVMLPRISNLTAGGQDAEKARLMGISMKYVMMLAFALAFGIASVAEQFAPLFFGAEFAGIGGLIVGLCVMLPFAAVQSVISTQHLLPTGRDRAYTGAVVAGAVVSVPLALVLIPHMGAMGAVVARVVAEGVVCCAVVWFSRKDLPLRQYARDSVFFLRVGVVMFILVRAVGGLLGDGWLPLMLRIGVGGAFYVAACAVWLYATRDEFFMRNVVRRRSV